MNVYCGECGRTFDAPPQEPFCDGCRTPSKVEAWHRRQAAAELDWELEEFMSSPEARFLVWLAERDG